MNGYVPAAVVIVALFAAAAFVCIDSDGSDADTTYTVTGLVTDGNTTPGGVSGVEVTIATTSDSESSTTDSNGAFSVTGLTANTDLSIKFYTSGMAVTYAGSIFTAKGDGTYALNLSGLTPVGGVYDISAYTVTMKEISLSMYLMEMGSEGNTAVSGASVTLKSSAFNYSETVTTESDGLFTFKPCSLYNLELSVDAGAKGYTILTDLLFFGSATGDGNLLMNIKGSNTSLGIHGYEFTYTTSTEGVREYVLDSSYPILVATSTGTVDVTVCDSSGNTLQGATVTLYSTDSSDKYIEETDENGVASIPGVVIGVYDISVEVGGFKEYEDQLTVTKGDNNTLSVDMISRTEQDFFGMNFSHFMMILGVAVGVFLMIFSYLMFSGHLRPRLEEE